MHLLPQPITSITSSVIKTNVVLVILLIVVGSSCQADVKPGKGHSASSRFNSYCGLVMCGYQGWFRTPGDGSGRGWTHYGAQGRFDPRNCTIDLWPDVSDYAKTYPTEFTLENEEPAHVFSSFDKSTTDLHFQWMREYGIDGVFMQRFFRTTRSIHSGNGSRAILKNALQAAETEERAVAIMYDLSGLRPGVDDCQSIINDWKRLVDELRIAARGDSQSYLYHNGGPLVAIWGLGFPDRPYSIREIGIERLIDFLKNDPRYGGCSLMLGVPTYFRTLDQDCLPDKHLHELIEDIDIVMPWTVNRFSSLDPDDRERYRDHVQQDLAWCAKRNVEYAPVIFPGFSWHNLSRHDPRHSGRLDSNPRKSGEFYWGLAHGAIAAQAQMLYVAMFDEMDEGTAIFKCTNKPPIELKSITYEGLPSDHYLWLTGRAGEMLRKERPLTSHIPARDMLHN